jgi:Protein of unknown function (DUF2817)
MTITQLAWLGIVSSVTVLFFLDSPDTMHADAWCFDREDRAKVTCYFSPSYQEARERFRRTASQVKKPNLAVHAFSKPLTTDSDLTIDFTVIRESSVPVTKFIVHSSGVHGVEGFSGSAIQLAALEAIKNGSLLIPPGSALLFIHAVNPYGMSRLRRVNENNVDLNRNGLANFKTAAKPRDMELATFLLLPVEPPGYAIGHVWFWFKAIYLLASRGFTELKHAIVTGQYVFPEGMFYGGDKTQESLRIVKDVLDELGVFSDSVIWIDVHTGLGHSGIDTMMVTGADKAIKAQQMFADSLVEAIDQLGGSASNGYEDMRGELESFFRKKKGGDKFLFVTQEFGTVNGIQVYRALRLENSAFHLDKESQRYMASIHLLPAFNPQSLAWRTSVILRGVDAVRRALEV